MTDNAQLPIFKVRPFAEMAESRGCYSKSQRGNLETAWTIFLKNISAHVESSDSTTIQQIRPLVDQVFRTYGSQNRVSPSTVRAYQTRVKRLLDDFVEHNGGDFMAWKESISRTASFPRRRRKSSVGIEEIPPMPLAPQTSDNVSHRIVLSEGREGALLLPSKFTDDDIDPVWEQLDALKTLIKAQIGALNKTNRKPSDTSEEIAPRPVSSESRRVSISRP
jgi:hypothetical protein